MGGGSVIFLGMVLADLFVLVEELRGRLGAHSELLGGNEAQTRYALIDPLLRGLGWDLADPAQVRVEYKLGGGWADYALLGEAGKPVIIVEAKKLGTALQGVVTQGVGYCIQEGVPYFALTDGQRWELYETFQPVPLKDKLVASLDLTESPGETCLKALALWRMTAAAGRVRPAAEPVIAQTEPAAVPSQPSLPSSLPTPPAPPPTGNWNPLDSFKPSAGSKPQQIRLPDGSAVLVHSWPLVNAAIVGWLRSQAVLQDGMLPVKFGHSQSYFLNLVDDRGAGQPFANKHRVDGWFMNTNYNAAQHMNNARHVIKFAGRDPAQFAVSVQD